MGKTEVKCGTIDAAYKGVAEPKLEPKFLQTEEERELYEPIMEDLVKNGLATSGTTISGI